MKKHTIVWHTYKVRFCRTYMLRINNVGDVKDSHKYGHITELEVTSAKYCTIKFVSYVPHDAWVVYCTDMEAFVNNLASYSRHQGITINVNFNGTKAFPMRDTVRASSLDVSRSSSLDFSRRNSTVDQSRRESNVFGSRRMSSWFG